ncbi:peptidoglycan-binding protein [bacterium]|nr:peptidoglycan-binding protein [bacterium]
MDKRLTKQAIVISVTVLFFIVIGLGIRHSLQPPPTCFDNKRNQGEEGIDCGGPCIPCRLKENPSFSLMGSPYYLPEPGGKIDIIFRLVNKDQEWGAKSFSYKVILEGDNQQKEEFIRSGFILPRQSKLFVLPLVSTNIKNPRIKIEILKDSIQWAKVVEGVKLDLGDPFIVTNIKVLTPLSPPGTEYNVYLFVKTLKLGMRDPEVYNLQKVLAQYPDIYPEGKISGYFDSATERAVKKFQRKYGIRTTGEVGPQTRAQLNELFGPKESEPFSYTFTKTLRRGMEGIEVINLQRALALDATVKPKGSISGYFGPATERAVKEFQKKYGIPATGEVGPLTRQKLNELFSHPEETKPRLPDEYFEPYEASLKVKGELYNTTPFHWKEGKVIIVLCDKAGNPVAVGISPLENIRYDKPSGFVIQWKQKMPRGVRVCEKLGDINVLSEDNVYIEEK